MTGVSGMNVYVYICSVGHVTEYPRPYPYAVVGCQALVAGGDFKTCGLWCWPQKVA